MRDDCVSEQCERHEHDNCDDDAHRDAPPICRPTGFRIDDQTRHGALNGSPRRMVHLF